MQNQVYDKYHGLVTGGGGVRRTTAARNTVVHGIDALAVIGGDPSPSPSYRRA